MSADWLSRIEGCFPRLQTLVANYRERREESVLIGIYRRVLAADPASEFTRNEVLYMASRVAAYDEKQRNRPSSADYLETKRKRILKIWQTPDRKG